MTEKYSPLFEEAFELIGTLYTTLKSTPIDVKKVDAAYNELSEKGDYLLNSLKNDKESLKNAEEAVVHANRYRSSDSSNNATLSQAETLFLDGHFTEAEAIAKTINGGNSERLFRRK